MKYKEILSYETLPKRQQAMSWKRRGLGENVLDFVSDPSKENNRGLISKAFLSKSWYTMLCTLKYMLYIYNL